MPRFFGQWDHLKADPTNKAALEQVQKYEPMEALGIAAYLHKYSQSFSNLPEPASGKYPADPQTGKQILEKDLAVEDRQVGRGKVFFETRGCIACHKHEAFPDATSKFGPDLSNLPKKFYGSVKGRKWLILGSKIQLITMCVPRCRISFGADEVAR